MCTRNFEFSPTDLRLSFINRPRFLPLSSRMFFNLPPRSEVESGRLVLPDVLPARTRNRLRGIFLCHRLPAGGTILAPHVGPPFPSTNRLRAGGHVKLIDHGVELFPPLKCCEKRERFPVGCNRS